MAYSVRVVFTAEDDDDAAAIRDTIEAAINATGTIAAVEDPAEIARIEDVVAMMKPEDDES